MTILPEPTRNDIRRIGGELSRLSFELLTVVGIGAEDEDEIHHKRITEALNYVEQAAQSLANILTDEPDDELIEGFEN